MGLKCVSTSRIDVLLKPFPLYTIVSRNEILSSGFSAVRLFKLTFIIITNQEAKSVFVVIMKCVICSPPVSGREKREMSPMNLF